jgi:flagella basal body P-ring formation protein FlgA
LGDIANVVPDGPEDQALAALLEAADLGGAPGPGQKLTLRRQQFESRLESSGAPVNDARWLIPDVVTLTGGGQEADSDVIRRVILDYLQKSEPYASGRFELISVGSAPAPALPAGQVEYRFAPQPSSNPGYLAGTVFFSVDGREAARLRVTALVDLEVPALLAVRDLSRGHVLAEEDLTESYVSFSRAKGSLTDTSQAAGQTLKVSVRAGSPIRDRDLRVTSLISKGDTVSIVAQAGGLKVTALGQAKEDGALGQTISVVNMDSKKIVLAKVIGPGQVEVLF